MSLAAELSSFLAAELSIGAEVRVATPRVAMPLSGHDGGLTEADVDDLFSRQAEVNSLGDCDRISWVPLGVPCRGPCHVWCTRYTMVHAMVHHAEIERNG